MTNRNMQSGKKWAAFWAGAIAFVIIFAVLAGVIGWRTKGYTDWTFGFGTEASKPDDKTPDNPDDGKASGDLVNVTEEKGISLASALIAPDSYSDYGIDAQADTAYTMTATVNSDAVDKSVVWSLSWKDPSSSWASGKQVSDYAVITPTAEFALTANLTVKQSFGEPVIVKVASCMNSNVNVTAQIDYLKKLVTFTATLNPSLSSTAAGRIYVGDTENTIQINLNYGVGTVEGEITSCKTTFTTNNYFRTNLQAAFTAGSSIGAGSFFPNETIVTEGLSFKIPFIGMGNNQGLAVGGGNTSGAEIIANNFIKAHGCGDATGNGASTAGVDSIEYEVVYSYGSEYSMTKTCFTDATHFNGATGFRNDTLTAIGTISNIALDKNGIVVMPE